MRRTSPATPLEPSPAIPPGSVDPQGYDAPVVRGNRPGYPADTLRARASLARWIGAAGDPVEAGYLFGHLTQVVDLVFGYKPHQESARMDAAAVPWYGKAGDPRTARNRALLLLTPGEIPRMLGPAHPDTLGVRRELARWTGLDGDPAAARDELAGLLPVMERVLGAEHPRTIAARQDLAHWTAQAAR